MGRGIVKTAHSPALTALAPKIPSLRLSLLRNDRDYRPVMVIVVLGKDELNEVNIFARRLWSEACRSQEIEYAGKAFIFGFVPRERVLRDVVRHCEVSAHTIAHTLAERTTVISVVGRSIGVFPFDHVFAHSLFHR